MAGSKTPRFPVTVTQLPLVRCAVCGRMLAHHPGAAGDVLTRHYTEQHPETLGLQPDDDPGDPDDDDR
jgi:hypothetical protein